MHQHPRATILLSPKATTAQGKPACCECYAMFMRTERTHGSGEFSHQGVSKDVPGPWACRVFIVSRVLKATGGFRPCFLFEGSLCEVQPYQGELNAFPCCKLATCSQSSDHELPSPLCLHAGGGHKLERVQNTRELQLSLRYEPPSPKFTRSLPQMASYRCVS